MLLAIAPGATATTVLKLDREELIARSARILEGQVERKLCRRDSQGRIVTVVSLRVENDGYLKGTGERTVELVFPGGVLEKERRGMIVPGIPAFSLGERVLLFVSDSGQGGMSLPVGLAQGKFTIEVDPKSGKKSLVRDLSGLRLIDPRTRRPARKSPSVQRFDYQEWRDAIRRKVDGGK